MTDANVLLVIADSLRARNTSLLGYRRETTPTLDAFAAEATTYTQARAPSNWTVPAHVSLFTGQPVAAHGFDIDQRLTTGETIWEELSDRGYDTGLFTDNPFLTGHESGLDQPFDHSEGTPAEWDETYDTNGSLGDWPNGFYYADRTLSWIDDRTEPWAACVNLMDTHRPYEPLAEYDTWSDDSVRALQEEMGFKWHWEFLAGEVSMGFASLLETIYDGAIRQADAIFERLVEGLADSGELSETLIVFTGDHGESFGAATPIPAEPPAVSHRIGTHDALYHVPLVVRAPGQRSERRVDELATLTRFPEAVRTLALDESLDGPAFAAPEATATQFPITDAMREEAARICGASEPYAKRADVVFEDRPGDRVHRRAKWGTDAHETLIRGRRETTDRGPVDAEAVGADVERIAGDPVTLGTPLADNTEFADDYKNEFADDLDDRLDALGYR